MIDIEDVVGDSLTIHALGYIQAAATKKNGRGKKEGGKKRGTSESTGGAGG
jgi:hypothetical protein